MTIGRKYERDIDLLLAEEFMVSKQFADWFLGKTKFRGLRANVNDVFVSKSDATGETDLLVMYMREEDSRPIAIHIEDKIDAPLQPEQASRYQLRAQGAVSQGKYVDFDIVLCSSEFYRTNQPDSSDFDKFVSYEEMANFIGANDPTLRGLYRSNFLKTASSTRINTWQKTDDDQTNRFWAEAYFIASREFPILEMKEPNLTKDSTWINFQPLDMPTMPQRIYISFKGDRGYMDLTFSNCVAHEFARKVESILEPDMTVHQTSKSSAIRLKVEGFKVSENFGSGLAKVRRSFSACERLIMIFRRHREILTNAASQSKHESSLLR
jgi:hypothetical protein